MLIGKVVNKVVSTRKHESLNGFKLLVVEPCFGTERACFVAADELGAGEGEIVIVCLGSACAKAINKEASVDAVVVGIIDDRKIIEQI